MKYTNYILIILLATLFNSCNSQKDLNKPHEHLREKLLLQIQNLEKALIEKDTLFLSNILDSKLSLGHSNGWIETKESLLENLPTSKIQYIEFRALDTPNIHFPSSFISTVRRKIIASGTYEGHKFDVILSVLEVWKLQEDSWILLARQSVEVEK